MAADPRVAWTPGALSHDRGGRGDYSHGGDVYQMAPVHWSPRMREAAREVMALPVPVRDEPVACSGEVTRGR